MYLDKRNKNKVIIIKDGKSLAIVKNLKDSKRYLVDKSSLEEIK